MVTMGGFIKPESIVSKHRVVSNRSRVILVNEASLRNNRLENFLIAMVRRWRAISANHTSSLRSIRFINV